MNRLHEIQQRIADAGGKGVRIIGVTKFQPVERVQALVDAGLGALGVNYTQAGEDLRGALAGYKGQWHFIGQIQSRKASALGDYDLVHSVDRLKVAERLVEGSSILLEVNLGEETSKGGVGEEGLEPLLEAVSRLDLRVRGLMALPPPLFPVEKRRPYFERLRQLLEVHSSYLTDKELSMGTSDDFEEAVKEGATMVRLGTTLFGPRAR